MSQTGMMQRCWEHDYCEPCFYMITIVTQPRRECLGVLRNPGAGAAPGTGPDAGAAPGTGPDAGAAPGTGPDAGAAPGTGPDAGAAPGTGPDAGAAPGTGPAGGVATVALSPLGEVVREVWLRTSAVYPGVEACECVMMPDHFHGILWVKERLARHMGHMVKAFKRVSEQECRSRGLLLPPNPAAPAGSVPVAAPATGLWQPGFQDSILLRRGQLKAMVAYIADNPRRLAAKRANPALFTVVAREEVFPGRTCAAIGNRFLLQHPLKHQVQISRRISPDELAARQEELLYAAEHGAVLVSPCISPGEKAIARAALDAGRPLVVLLANGFAPHYKPPGRYFDACAAGRLLMLAPFPYHRQRQTITSEQCLELNAWAQVITEEP